MLGEVIAFYNKAMTDLPADAQAEEPAACRRLHQVLDGKGERYAEVYPDHRRIWVPLRDIPDHVQKAFVTAEDKRFYQHKGVDERGHHPRLHHQYGGARPAAGRLDHHPAGREESAGRRRRHL